MIIDVTCFGDAQKKEFDTETGRFLCATLHRRK